MHYLPEAPLHKSVIFLGDWTTVIGADFHIGPNNRLLTLTFTLTLTCGAGKPVDNPLMGNPGSATAIGLKLPFKFFGQFNYKFI